ncbi:UNVERIFIED_ORG: SnoaL-like protein [Nocardia globerula]|uniref:SnoaL-like protein n=1 Tax=Nocardia globerula TaxID=1818 RepID=A0A652YT62_NOCGL|nr:nuclear transport factor 2 family protein [Rhodococcus globerulus]NMD61385.1 SnoaL-like domain-containing protein [Nocardia globerula]PVX67065.1 SnoaL-like protein [Rhodococcus globerulus]
MSLNTFDREEVEQAFRRYITVGLLHEDWVGFAELFTEDGEYRDHFYGTFTGPVEIGRYLEGTMGAAPAVYNPLVWYTIDGNRVVYKILNRVDNPEPGAPPIDFESLQIITYAGGGKWSAQEDWWVMYEMKQFGAAVAEASRKFPQPETAELSRKDWGPWVDWARPEDGHIACPSWMTRDNFVPIRSRADIDFRVRNT